jgi:hypothetical protein
MAQNFEDLLVWQKAVDLAVQIYALTERSRTTSGLGSPRSSGARRYQYQATLQRVEGD